MPPRRRRGLPSAASRAFSNGKHKKQDLVRPALPINRAAGAHKAPCRPLKHAPGLIRPSPRQGAALQPPRRHAATTGHTVRHDYDVLHRPVKVIDPDEDTDPTNNPVWQTIYNAADEVIATIDPLGRQTSYGYDAASRVTLIDHDYVDSQGNATPLADFAYTWDAAGQIVAYSGPKGTRTYAYDPQGQLTDVWDGQGNLIEYYRYTPNGNRTESHLHGTGYVTGADNRLLSDGTNDYEYDNEGNLIRKTNTVTGEVTEYSWDYRNRLTVVVHKDGQGNVLWTETYVYDAFNRRIAFYEDPDGPTGPEPERFTFVLHDLAQPPTAEQIAQGGLAPYVDGIYASAIFAANPIADFTDADTSDGITPQLTEGRLYAAAIDSLLAREDALGDITFDVTDYLGSVRGWVNRDGGILETMAYESFGLPFGGWWSSSRFGYAGREWSGQSGVWCMRARAVSSLIGRFLAPDPLGHADTTNSYSYGHNRPVSLVDLTGTTAADPSLDAQRDQGNGQQGEPQAAAHQDGWWEKLKEKMKNWIKALIEATKTAAGPPVVTEAAEAVPAAAGILLLKEAKRRRGEMVRIIDREAKGEIQHREADRRLRDKRREIQDITHPLRDW